MKSIRLVTLVLLSAGAQVCSDAKDLDVAALIESSCIGCHDSGTDTDLDFESLDHDLSDSENFRMWEKVFDRVSEGEMPPASEERPDPAEVKLALDSLKQALHAASRSRQQRVGRVPARRLTKTELGNTLNDLLFVNGNVTVGVPDEVEAGSFDTVGANQRVSAVHMESYLDAADRAMDLAVSLERNPYRESRDHADSNFAHLEQWHDKPLNLGGSVTRKLKYGKGIVLFADIDYLTQFTYGIRSPGIYRLEARVAAYQSQEPLTAKIIVKNNTGGARLAKAFDLPPDEPQLVTVETYLKPGDTPYLTFRTPTRGFTSGVFAAGGAQNYRGPGLAILSQSFEGPISDQWPLQSTQQLLSGLKLEGSESGPFRVSEPDNVNEWIRDLLSEFAPRAFRRPVEDDELERFVELAQPAIADGRDVLDVVRIPLRSILSSPQFLMFDSEPGPLNDYALASRLSYFLWKSMPDDELFELASNGQLTNPDVLASQVERMLSDEKSSRFIQDYVGQWLWLNKVNATTPDDGLYPEFDELLANSIPQETQAFFASLVKDNLSLRNVVDSDFTFVNRRLAEHYGIEGVEGQDFRRIELPEDSVRGGVLTQAAVLKTSANGTTTSPVMRGNFVLTNLLGTPPSAPPPAVGSIEPDTRGQTTIREILAAHREIESCNQCHREIDPPGFALESFDPIGRYRTFYRVSGGQQEFGGFVIKNPPKRGPPVDASGVTASGAAFSDVSEFKRELMKEHEQIARNFISQLIVYATGAEIQFADRDQVESILNDVQGDDYRVRDIIHRVVQSDLFLKL